ncbi:MAG TPA: rhodanese-like domain-containing protein [Candidatus Binataceae bacterium]|nr:rhodanese-like domain-containing protein [Candidatus Binataceae bacterium]
MRSIDHHEVLRLITEGAQVVDALPAHEYNPVHLPGAIHMPLGRVLREARQKLARETPIIVYCRDSL